MTNEIHDRNYYVFNPNNGEFISGPMSCKNLARIRRNEKRPLAGAPENEPYVVVGLVKEDIMRHKVNYKKNVYTLTHELPRFATASQARKCGCTIPSDIPDDAIYIGNGVFEYFT